MIPESDLEEMKSLTEAASSGPWVFDEEFCSVYTALGEPRLSIFVTTKKLPHCENLKFIAASRTIVPRLLEEVKSLKIQVTTWRENFKIQETTLSQTSLDRDSWRDAANQHLDQYYLQLKLWEKQLCEIRQLEKQLAAARKENAQFRAERLELEKSLEKAWILSGQRQDKCKL